MEPEPDASTRLRSPFGLIVRNRDLLRLLIAFAVFSMAEWATWVAVIVFAYQRGGASEAGLVAVVQLVPSALVAPLASALGDRHSRRRFLVLGYSAQALSMSATGVAMILAPAWVAFAMAALAAMSVTLARPGQGAFLPALVASPRELTAANAAQGAIESFAFLTGPAISGVLLGLWGPHVVFLAMAGGTGISAILTASIRARGEVPDARTPGLHALAADAMGGFRTLGEDAHVRVVVGMTAGQSLVIGALDILTVALALGVLRTGPSGAGYLTASIGAGGMAGSVVAVTLIRRRRLSSTLALGALALGLPVVLIGLVPARVTAVTMLITAGAGRVILDVGGRTLLQRLVADEVLTRIFGVLEGLYMAALALGSLAASAMVALAGPREALVAVGCALPILLLVAWARLMRIDRDAPAPDARRIELLRADPMFAPLPAMALERLAASLVPVDAIEGTFIMRQGEPGDRFYLVAEGEVAVERDGRRVATGSRGFSFGEIALLRSVPRTASVRAVTPVRLLSLDREPFLRVVTGNPRSAAAAAATADSRVSGPAV